MKNEEEKRLKYQKKGLCYPLDHMRAFWAIDRLKWLIDR